MKGDEDKGSHATAVGDSGDVRVVGFEVLPGVEDGEDVIPAARQLFLVHARRHQAHHVQPVVCAFLSPPQPTTPEIYLISFRYQKS